MKSVFKTTILCLGFVLFCLPLAYADITITVKEPDTHFFSSEEIPRTLILHNQGADKQVCQLAWTTSILSAVVQQGRRKVILAAQEKKEVDIVLVMPKVKARPTLEWQIEVSPHPGERSDVRFSSKNNLEENVTLPTSSKKFKESWLEGSHEILPRQDSLAGQDDQSGTRVKNTPTGQLTINYEVFPQQSLAGIRSIFDTKRAGIYDPLGTMERLFKQEDIRYTSIKNSLTLEAFEGDLLLIANNAATDKKESFFSVLMDKVYKGIAVIFLEQEIMPDQSVFPPLLQDGPSTKIRYLVYGHSLFDNLGEGDLQNWRGDGVIARLLLEKPQKGNFLVLADAADANGQNRKGALILEIPYGKGRFIFSQLLIMEKIDSEPIATILLEQIIRYALMRPKAYEKVALFGQAEDPTFNFFNELGVVSVGNPSDINSFQHIIITPGIDSVAGINHFVKRGGRLIIFDITPDLYLSLRQVFPYEIAIVKNEGDGPLSFKKENPLLWGITEEDLAQCRFTNNSLQFEEAPEARELIDSGKMAIFSSGSAKGNVILCQLDFGNDDDDEELGALNNRVASQLLSNIGVAISADIFGKNDRENRLWR